MGLGIFRLFAAIYIFTAIEPLYGASLERFVGVLRHEKLKRDQLAKLDLILSRSQDNKLELSGVLTLHFGDFKSREYVAYHFHKVHYFLLDQTFTFDQANQGVTIRRAKLVGDTLTGELRSEFSGNAGTLILTRTGTISPKYPLIEPVWGEYRGKCDPYKNGAYKSTVQIYSYRSPEDTSRVGNPFAPYSVKGFLAQDKGTTCIGDIGSRMCIWSRFYASSYNFFKERLVLFGRNKNLTCRTTPEGLDCNGCLLKRSSNETEGERTLTPPNSKAFFSEQVESGETALTGSLPSIEGEYFGYLHHEYLDAYQPLVLNILTYPVSEGGGQVLKMSATATVSFGKFDSAESITYRFQPRNFPNPLIMGQFVFDRAEADVDAILQITKIGKGMATGQWYSQLFGKVGSFVLKKEEPPELPEGTALIPPLSGEYTDGKWDIDLAVGLGSTPPNTENPFYPLTFAGRLNLRSFSARTIVGGSYDFYTGRLAIEAESSDRGVGVFVGYRRLTPQLHLKPTYRGFLTSLPSHDLSLFPGTDGSEQ